MINTSAMAIRDLDVAALENMVYNIVKSYGEEGCISDQVRQDALTQYGVEAYSSTTARYAQLIRKGLIFRTGETRAGKSGRPQNVMVALSHASEEIRNA